MARKRPCRICRRWFRPDPRIAERQRCCSNDQCQEQRRVDTQARWREAHPDYFIARRMQERAAQGRDVEPMRVPAPLDRLPWDVAQDQFTVQGADFIAVFGRLLLRQAQDEMEPQPSAAKGKSRRHGGAVEKDQMTMVAKSRPP